MERFIYNLINDAIKSTKETLDNMQLCYNRQLSGVNQYIIYLELYQYTI